MTLSDSIYLSLYACVYLIWLLWNQVTVMTFLLHYQCQKSTKNKRGVKQKNFFLHHVDLVTMFYWRK